MKKFVIPAAVMLLLQLIVGFACLKIIVGQIESAGIGLGGFTGQTQLWPLGLIAFISIPILLGKWLSDALNQPISWKRSIAIYFGVIGIAILVAVLWSTIHSFRY